MNGLPSLVANKSGYYILFLSKVKAPRKVSSVTLLEIVDNSAGLVYSQ